MKIIFLDIDGVLALGKIKRKETKWGNIYRFDGKAVKLFNELLDKTGAEIVLSSDWKKNHSLQDMREIFEWNGINKGPISFTVNSPMYEEAESMEWMAGGRAWEIKEYVERHGLTEWLALDDLKLHESGHGDFFEGHFVFCGRTFEGVKQTSLKYKAIKILNGDEQEELG